MPSGESREWDKLFLPVGNSDGSPGYCRLVPDTEDRSHGRYFGAGGVLQYKGKT